MGASKRWLSNFHPIASHKDTDDNTENTYFDFTPENYRRYVTWSIKRTV